jgi:hypothetical protein
MNTYRIERVNGQKDNIHELAEKMAGKMTMVEQRLFLHRFMTWYARHNPDYNDPRLFTHYAERAINAAPATTMRAMMNRLFGRKR